MVQKYIVSRDDGIYQAWPDVALTGTGRLVCVFAECTHHNNRDYTRIMFVKSDDRGRTWTQKQAISEPLHKRSASEPHWNCPRITALRDGRLCVAVDTIAGGGEGHASDGRQLNYLFFSADDAESWSGPTAAPVRGIVPDRLLELAGGSNDGRWLLSAHSDIEGVWKQRVWLSDDRGASWRGPITVASDPALKLCEGSIFPLPGGELCCLLRENSSLGLDAYKTISTDGGESWSPLTTIALPACHRPVGGVLASGRILVTHRYMQGGGGWLGWWTQNVFAGLTDLDSCLASSRSNTRSRIMPLDYDRSPVADTGYTGWVQFSDGEIYVVNYIVDDAPKAHIRGYSFYETDMVLTTGN